MNSYDTTNWRRILIAIVALVGIIIVFLIAWNYYLINGFSPPSWTGFGEATKVLIPPTPGTPSVEYIPPKTLWDWMQLLVVPLVLAGGALWFNRQERKSERYIQKQRDQTEREIAADRAKETLLQNYFDKMTELLLDKGLLDPDNKEAQVVARARTLATARQLDGERKGLLLRFLYEAKLITEETFGVGSDIRIEKKTVIISLEGVDFSAASLDYADLRGAHLQGAILREANLLKADLRKANLEKANLGNAILANADLREAHLQRATLKTAYLDGADLRGADLMDATLVGVRMRGANLQGANLRGAELREANLERSIITDEQFAQALSLKGAFMPDGSIFE